MRLCLWCCCTILTLAAASALADTADQTRSQQQQQQHLRTLSRKRRYLIFPEGSSFQLVYDQIIPIVDYTNLLIFGVTTALAWPLPDKPIDDAKLREMFANGTAVPFRRIDDDDDDAAATETAPPSASAELSTDARVPDAYYAGRRPPDAPPQLNQLYDRDDRYYWADRISSNQLLQQRNDEQLISRLASNGASYRPWTASAGWSARPSVRPAPAAAPQRRHHRIYPALGKRSVRNRRSAATVDPDEHLSLHLHRSTRHTLYASVERYLAAHGQPGDACVRRALCETSRKRHSDADGPGSFVGELMRVVFSLPDVAVTDDDHERLRREDGYHEAAHGGGANVDCAVKYAACAQSVWESVYTV